MQLLFFQIEILRNLLEDSRVEDQLTRAILKQDRLGWNPIMASTKADSGVEEIVEMFLTFLETRIEQDQVTTTPISHEKNFLKNICYCLQLALLFDAENISKDTVFTLLMRNNEHFGPCRKILFQILTG